MSNLSVLRFFYSPADPNFDQLGLDDEKRKSLCLRSNLVLLSGPLATGKTSLVWAFCQSVCCSLEHNAYIVCDRKRLERGQATPMLTEGSSTNSVVWKRASIKYVESVREVQQVISCLHEISPLPKCVAIDLDWSLLLSGVSKVEAARSLGLVFSALAEFAEFAKKFGCMCIVTDSGGDELVAHLTRKYLTSVVSLTSVNAVIAVMNLEEDTKIKYSLANNMLAFNTFL